MINPLKQCHKTRDHSSYHMEIMERVHIVAQQSNRYIMAFHIAISYHIYLLTSSMTCYGEHVQKRAMCYHSHLELHHENNLHKTSHGKSSESVQCSMLKACDACADMGQL